MSDILRVPVFSRLDEYFASLWLIEPLAAEALWRAAQHVDLAAHVQMAPPKLEPSAELVEAKNGKTVAVIPMVGPLMKQRSSLGGTSTVQVRRDVRNAAADPNISAILLAVESPGGIVAGIDDLATDIKNANRVKPVWVQAEDLMASAAYWVGSQADQIFANSPTALIGSIGTYLTVFDQSGVAEKEGIKVLHFATGPLKGAGIPGTAVTPEQQAYFKGIVDGVQSEFDRAVRAGRWFSVAQMDAVRTGGVWKAPEAQARGLIDGVQPISKTIEQLSRAAAERSGDRKRAGVFPPPARAGLPTLRGVLP